MIYTSYFANLKKIQNTEHKEYKRLFPISIALYQPKGLTLNSIYLLAPRRDMLKMTEENYRIEYQKILDSLKVEKVSEIIGGNAVLLCWERPEKFCHRHLLAEWLNKNGYNCEELNLEEEPNDKK